MGWGMSGIRAGVMRLFGNPGVEEQSLLQLEHIRDEMRDCAVFFLPHQAEPAEFWQQLQDATDIQSLWYLRSDLMNLLSCCCGEDQARRLIRQITGLFRGYLPAAQFESARYQRVVLC